MAELLLPAAGNTVSNRLRDSSRYTLTPGLTAKGQTPPTAWPTSPVASSAVSILAFVANCCLYLWLSTLASPAATISTGPPSTMKDRVLAMRASSQPTAWAARATVALETSNSRMRSSMPQVLKYALTFSIDIIVPPL